MSLLGETEPITQAMDSYIPSPFCTFFFCVCETRSQLVDQASLKLTLAQRGFELVTILPEHQLKATGLNHQARAGYATPFSNSLEKQSVREENQTNTKQKCEHPGNLPAPGSLYPTH